MDIKKALLNYRYTYVHSPSPHRDPTLHLAAFLTDTPHHLPTPPRQTHLSPRHLISDNPGAGDDKLTPASLSISLPRSLSPCPHRHLRSQISHHAVLRTRCGVTSACPPRNPTSPPTHVRSRTSARRYFFLRPF